MNHRKIYKLIFLLLLSCLGCEKEIYISIPPAEEKLVVEGFIEQGMPPIVILTKSSGYFESTDISSMQNTIIKDADVFINNGTQELKLTQLCVNTLPDSMLPYISSLTGLTPDHLKLFDYCFYTTLNSSLWGEAGKTYTLSINHRNKNYKAVSSIPQLVPLDSLWFIKRTPEGNLGTIWARLSDPPFTYNAYRIFTKRLGRDESYTPSWGSVFEDKFFDGKTFDFYFYRGSKANSENPDDNNIERAFFRTGDTIVVKFCSIDNGVFRFIRDLETEVSNNGNPFAAPLTIHSNITNGALGYWAGYGAAYDTIIANEK